MLCCLMENGICEIATIIFTILALFARVGIFMFTHCLLVMELLLSLANISERYQNAVSMANNVLLIQCCVYPAAWPAQTFQPGIY